MSATEIRTLDMAAIILKAYELGDFINGSVLVSEYSEAKRQVEEDLELAAIVGRFEKAKERFEECKRFGHFHPNYHEALQEVHRIQEELDQRPAVARFKAAERALDELLYAVSERIARSVSDTIKVPANDDPLSGGGCGSGGSCSGKCS